MKVRSLGLAILGSGMIAASALLGAILVHDGEVEPAPVSAIAAGDPITLKGRPEPFHPHDLGAWASIRPLLGNHTYLLEPAPGLLAILSSATPLPDDVLRFDGQVLFAGPMGAGMHDHVLVVLVDAWREPILFH